MPTLPWLQDIAFAFAMASHDRLGKDSTASAVAGDNDLVFSVMCYAFPADKWNLKSRLGWISEQNISRYRNDLCTKKKIVVDRMRPTRSASQILEFHPSHFAVPGSIEMSTTAASGALSCRPSCACQSARGSQNSEEQNCFVLVSSNEEDAPPECEHQSHGSDDSRCWEWLDGASWIAQSLAGDETAPSDHDLDATETQDNARILGRLIGFSIINQIPLGIRLDIKLCRLLSGEEETSVTSEVVAGNNEHAGISPSIPDGLSSTLGNLLSSYPLFETSVANAVFEIIPARTLKALSSLEIQQVVQGFPIVDVDALRSSTHYFVFSDSAPIMEWFWGLLKVLNVRARRFLLSWTLGYIDTQNYENAKKAFDRELQGRLFALGLQGGTSSSSGNNLSQLDWRTRACNYEIFDAAPWVKRKKCRSFYGRKLLTPPFYIACQIFGNNLGRNTTYCELLMPMFTEKDTLRKALVDLLPPDLLEENRSALYSEL
uniref:HECT domain-containing protein n=1 Tax=Hanusia phi TaxID=3032 RepID=A0A7S0I1E0_9CRYP|mmetsp:Transcript_7973/g.18188  ORF Transcript_7973/g.18188 Transcript_7973/m.18188 type:complete len:488 (+) Transcript_7973:41-1504(+)